MKYWNSLLARVPSPFVDNPHPPTQVNFIDYLVYACMSAHVHECTSRRVKCKIVRANY